jgi:hypothetical protein
MRACATSVTPLNARMQPHLTHVGQAVPRIQRVLGVEFSYQPPPKSTVPFAASLKGTHIGLQGQGQQGQGHQGQR